MELLVVVAILGVLAAVGIVAYSGYLAKAKKTQITSQHNMIANFIRMKISECVFGADYFLTGKYGNEVQNNCNEYFELFSERSDVYNAEGGDIFYFHFHRDNGYKNILEKYYQGDDPSRSIGISTGWNENISAGHASKPGYTGIAPFGKSNLSGGDTLYKWCPALTSGIVVVTSLIIDPADWAENETSYAPPLYAKNDTRLVSCIPLE